MFRKISACLIGCLVGSMLLTTTAFAHHSFAMFESVKEISVVGTVTKFEWTNPHTWIELDVVNEDGSTMHWSIEAGSILALKRQGWTSSTLKTGDKISIAFHPLRDGRPGGSLLGLVTVDGKALGLPVQPPAAKK